MIEKRKKDAQVHLISLHQSRQYINFTEVGVLSVSIINERLKTEHSHIRFRSCIIKTSLEEILQLLERAVERFYTLDSKVQGPFPTTECNQCSVSTELLG